MDNGAQDMTKIREYGIGAQIIKYLGIEDIELLSDSKNKEFVGISGFGLSVVKNTKTSETVI